MNEPRGSVAKAALLGGILSGLFSSIPFLGSLNACCCALVVLGGVFSAWVLYSDTQGRVGNSSCGLAGFLSGALAGAMSVLLSGWLNRLVLGEEATLEQVKALEKILGGGQDASPLMKDALGAAMRGAQGLELNAWTVVAAAMMAVFCSFFGLLGGLAGHAILRRRSGPGPDAPQSLGSLVPPPPPPPAAGPPAPWEGSARDPFVAPDEPQGLGEIPYTELPALPPPPPAPPADVTEPETPPERRREDDEPR